MRRLLFPAMLAAVVSLVACATPPANRSLETYQDPAGLFSSRLPDDHAIQVIPQGGEMAPGVTVLSGVTTSPQSSGQTGRLSVGSQDRSTFLIYALSSDTLATAADVESLLTGDAAITLDTEETFAFPDGPGTLIVGTYKGDTQDLGVAAGFLVHDSVGYMVIEVFPPGQWASQEADFREVLSSFHAGGALGAAAVPLPSAG
jgi:hypothetical protein